MGAGLIGAGLVMALCYYYAVRYDLPREQAFSLRYLWAKGCEAGWALTLPVIILGGIFGGFVTATEGAGLAVVAALLIGVFVYREISLDRLYPALVDGVNQTAVVMLLVGVLMMVAHIPAIPLWLVGVFYGPKASPPDNRCGPALW
ncbi:MAG: TRAP transporter large permease subunit [Paracoccaceae bacterium]|nr:TRAP transporter large permease subunit [Paracoccaceae bacterium]